MSNPISHAETIANPELFIKQFELGKQLIPLADFFGLNKLLPDGVIDEGIRKALTKIEEKRAKYWVEGADRERDIAAIGLVASIMSTCAINSAQPQYWRDRQKASDLAFNTLDILEEAVSILNSSDAPEYLQLKKAADPALADDPQSSIDAIRDWLEAIQPEADMLVGRNTQNQNAVTAREKKIVTGISNSL